MSRKLVNMRLPEELLAATDAEAGRLGQTRTKFVERALESALDRGERDADRQAPDEGRPVSSRAPVEKGSDTRKGASSQGTPASSRLARPSLRDTWSR